MLNFRHCCYSHCLCQVPMPCRVLLSQDSDTPPMGIPPMALLVCQVLQEIGRGHMLEADSLIGRGLPRCIGISHAEAELRACEGPRTGKCRVTLRLRASPPNDHNPNNQGLGSARMLTRRAIAATTSRTQLSTCGETFLLQPVASTRLARTRLHMQ